jgi:preprotein translocase subunit SecG
VESFQGVESMFGTKTNAFLTRTTTILSIVFFISCLSLAIISVRQSKSLLADVKAPVPAAPTANTPESAAAPQPSSQPQPQAQPDNNAPVAAKQ